jgi:kynurenine formamidase
LLSCPQFRFIQKQSGEGETMKVPIIAVAVACSFALSTGVRAQVSDKPFQENWAPTKWGKDDSAGSSNHTKNPANIARAISMIKQNKSVTLGKYYHKDIPAVGERGWKMVLPGTPHAGPFGKNAMIYHDEYVSTEIGQIGTQFDGPGHIGVNTTKGMFMYNGRMYPASYERGGGGRAIGMGPNGVEHVGENGFICRGIVLDAAGYRGLERLPIPKKPGEIGIVTADDVKAMIKRQGIAEPQPGDCVFLHTGHGNIWGNSVYKKMDSAQHAKAREDFGAGEPGFGISACEYMASRDIALMGGDTSSNDAQPSGEFGTDYAVHCHTEMQTRRGIWNLENMDLKPLVDAKVYEFAFIWAPLKIIGGTGSPGNPIAIY